MLCKSLYSAIIDIVVEVAQQLQREREDKK